MRANYFLLATQETCDVLTHSHDATRLASNWCLLASSREFRGLGRLLARLSQEPVCRLGRQKWDTYAMPAALLWWMDEVGDGPLEAV